jgi:inosose dehydratase
MTTRREFAATAAVSATLAALGVRGAQPAEPELSLGFSLYGMKSLPLAQALSECRRIGYRNVELALIAGFPTEPARLSPEIRAVVRRELAEAKLPVSSLLINLSLAADEKANASHLQNLELAARFAAEISPASPPIVQTVMGGAPKEWEERKAIMASRLRDWDAIARKHRVTVAVKAHVSSAVNSPERLLWALREANGANLAVAYDHSHYALAGLSIADSLRPLAPHTRFVHIKDARMDGKDVRFLLPGEGTTDYAAYFRQLRAAGYRGPCVVEVSSQIFNRPSYDPIAAAERCHAALAPALGA